VKRLILHSVLLGMLLASVEGAADAVRVADPVGDSSQHDIHHPQHADHEPTRDDGSDADDHDACHCNAHLPPLAFAVARLPIAAAPERITLQIRRAASPGDPPPLPPPIA
jgi:hypothetical protein